jgi:glycosyltransferase involved in cell wall biosynthesis
MPPRACLLYVVSEDWVFLSHRLPMARAARDAGFEVHVATQLTKYRAKIEAEGFRVHAIPFARGKLSPLAALSTIVALRRLHTSLQPDLCHHVSLQVSVLGSVAAIGRRFALINALTGLGYAFSASGLKPRVMRMLLGGLFRCLFVRDRAVVLVQNPDDRTALLSLDIPEQHVVLISGSGVDAALLSPLPEPPGTIAVAFVGRLLDDKGVRSLVDAYRQLKARGVQVALLLAGTTDPANPTSLPEREVEGWKDEAGLSVLGHVEDISQVWARAHIAALPSRREGLPKSLLEAAACGRPMIATDVPGCREIVRPGQTGLLVPLDNASSLASAIETLINSPELRVRYGAAARQLVLDRFDSQSIGRQIVALYRRLTTSSSTVTPAP